MRKAILARQATPDGFIEGPYGELNWAMKDEEETWNDVFDPQRSADTLLLGRVKYPGFEKILACRSHIPIKSKNEMGYARLADKMQKIVFSKTMKKVERESTRIVQDHITYRTNPKKETTGREGHGALGQRQPCIDIRESWLDSRV